MEIERHIEKSARVDTRGVDLVHAARVGLSDDEAFVLTYFADVENQSLRYLRTLLGMKIAFRPDVAAFLATWDYEEFFHGYELERLMRACGRVVADDRREQKQGASRGACSSSTGCRWARACTRRSRWRDCFARCSTPSIRHARWWPMSTGASPSCRAWQGWG
jgi:hypothetical protein